MKNVKLILYNPNTYKFSWAYVTADYVDLYLRTWMSMGLGIGIVK